jgi:hypothetical protein
MRIKALKTLLDGREYTRKGEIVPDVDDWKARELIALGYAVQVPEPEESIAAPIVFGRADGNEAFTELQAGGRDGLETPASSSPAAPVPERPTLSKRRGKRGS